MLLSFHLTHGFLLLSSYVLRGNVPTPGLAEVSLSFYMEQLNRNRASHTPGARVSRTPKPCIPGQKDESPGSMHPTELPSAYGFLLVRGCLGFLLVFRNMLLKE